MQYELKLYESREGDFATISILPVIEPLDYLDTSVADLTSFEITIYLPMWVNPKPLIHADIRPKCHSAKTSADYRALASVMSKWEKAIGQHEAQWGAFTMDSPQVVKAGIFMTALGIKSLVVNGREEPRSTAILALKEMVRSAHAKIVDHLKEKADFINA